MPYIVEIKSNLVRAPVYVTVAVPSSCVTSHVDIEICVLSSRQ